MNGKHKQQAAYPVNTIGGDHVGLTKLELYAAMAMQGLLASNECGPHDVLLVANQAIRFARALRDALECEEER